MATIILEKHLLEKTIKASPNFTTFKKFVDEVIFSLCDSLLHLNERVSKKEFLARIDKSFDTSQPRMKVYYSAIHYYPFDFFVRRDYKGRYIEAATFNESEDSEQYKKIAHELYNHEAYFTGSLLDAFEALKHLDITIEDIRHVYINEYERLCQKNQ